MTFKKTPLQRFKELPPEKQAEVAREFERLEKQRKGIEDKWAKAYVQKTSADLEREAMLKERIRIIALLDYHHIRTSHQSERIRFLENLKSDINEGFDPNGG